MLSSFCFLPTFLLKCGLEFFLQFSSNSFHLMRGTAISIFIFIINNIGGNAPLIVPPIRSSLGLHKSLFLVYAGFYGFSSLFFLLSQLAYFIWKPTIDFKQPIKGIQLKNLKD